MSDANQQHPQNQMPPPGINPNQNPNPNPQVGVPQGPPAQGLPQPPNVEVGAQVPAKPQAQPPATEPNGLGQVLVDPSVVTLHGHEKTVQNYRVVARYIKLASAGKHEMSAASLKAALKALAEEAMFTSPKVQRVEIPAGGGEPALNITKPNYSLAGNRTLFDREKIAKLEKEKLLQLVGAQNPAELFEHELTITLTGDVAAWFLQNSYIPSYGQPGQETAPVPEGLKLAEKSRLTHEAVAALESLIASAATPEQREAARKLLRLGTKTLTIGD